MKNGMKKKDKQRNILGMLLGAILSILTPELMKEFVDHLLDWLENYVLGTKSKVDDLLILPVIERVRVAFDIPDEPEKEKES